MKYVLPVAIIALSTAFAAHAQGQTKSLASPPQMLSLGSNASDGTITVACEGKAPYARLSCHAYRLWIVRPAVEDHKKTRAALQADLATNGDELFKKMRSTCSEQNLTDGAITAKTKDFAPGRAASVRNGHASLKVLCGCATTQCFSAWMMEQQTHEQNECTVHAAAFPVDFVKVNDRKWVSNNGPEGICGVVSVFTIEHEVSDPILWTYTEHLTYTNNNAGLCKGLKDEQSTYSWRLGPSVRLVCEEFKFDTFPEQR